MPSACPSAAHGRAFSAAAASLLATLLLVSAPRASQHPRLRLAGPEIVAGGVELLRSTDASVLDQAAPGPVSVALLRLDPMRVTLGTALAGGCAPARETVQAIAARERAVAAVNAGFFGMRGAGAPAGLLKHRGRWIGGTFRARGAVAFLAHGDGEPVRLAFARVTVAASLVVARRWRSSRVPLDHLSPDPATRGLSFHAEPCSGRAAEPSTPPPAPGPPPPAQPAVTATWFLRPAGSAWTVVSAAAAPTDAPPGAAWLVYRGPAIPPALARVRAGDTLAVEPRIDAPAPRLWRDAPDAVGGAGMLVSGGRAVTDWTPERTLDSFRTDRHPRTVVGVDGEGRVHLIAVDGRNPAVSVGMSFPELQRLCLALGLRDALNLDGGGSTTLVVNGRVVNHPSDLTGPRPVSDAIVVRLRGGGP